MRQLSQIEQALTLTNISFPLAAVCVLKIKNGPSVQALQASLNQIQKEYLFLQCFIKEKNGRFWFEQDMGKNPITLKVVERIDGNHWLKLVREELNLGFNHRVSPLMRTIYLRSPSDHNSEIILSFHHAIMDATFQLSLTDLLLKLVMDKETNPEKLSTSLKAPPASPVLENHFPPPFKMPRLFFKIIPFILRQLREDRIYKKSTLKVKDSDIPASSENDILTIGFTEEETKALIKWSRKNNVSLNSIIVATMLIVVNRSNYNGKKTIMRTAQFSNLRPYLNPPVATNTAGSFIAMMRFNIPVSENDGIAEIAKKFDQQIILSNKKGDKFLFSLLSKMLIKKSFREQKERLGATALSYAGPVLIKKQYGNIVVNDVHGFITNNCLGPELTGFGKICFKRLSLDLNFLSSETSKEKALSMGNEIEKLLKQLIVNR